VTPLPPLAESAQRALASIGVRSLEGVAACRVDGLPKLSGIDAEALKILDEALDRHGWSFAESPNPEPGSRA
jgi:hypothetical protein